MIPLPGGFQPRAAVGYMTVAALEVGRAVRRRPALHSEIDVAAAHAERARAEWGPDGAEDALAKQLARGLHGTIPVIAGAGLTAPVAYRWKTQLNENAKVPAFAHELPELDHNEIVGWSGAAELGRFSAVFLDDSDLHPRDAPADRADARPDRLGRGGRRSASRARGETRMERLVSLVLLGDLVSLYLAVLRGIDPTPVDAIEQLKSALNGG